jgi:hypothetical protein
MKSTDDVFSSLSPCSEPRHLIYILFSPLPLLTFGVIVGFRGHEVRSGLPGRSLVVGAMMQGAALPGIILLAILVPLQFAEVSDLES